jgi:hypothetical protein
MARGHISKRSVNEATPGQKDWVLWDDDVGGFGLKVTPKGRRVYLVQYRMGGRNSPTKRVSIGVHGTLTPDQARSNAKRILLEVANGLDPKQRGATSASLTVGAALDRFLVEHVQSKLKPRTAEEYKRTVKLHVGPTF